MSEINGALNKIRIAAPCGAVWDQMFGNERKRFCSECHLNVYNISDMTKVEAESFLLNSEGRVCLRVYRRADGTVITRNCPKGWARLKKRGSRIAGSCLALLAGILGGMGFDVGLRKGAAMIESAVVNEFKEKEPDSNPFSITDGILENLSEINLSLRGRSD